MTIDELINRPELLAKLGLVARYDNEQGTYKLFDATTGNRVNNQQILQSALDDASRLDSQGRPDFGTSGPASFAGYRAMGGDVTVNGSKYRQYGSTYDDLMRGYGDLAAKAGVRPEDFAYDPTYGNVEAVNDRTDVFSNLLRNKIKAQNEGGFDKIASMGPILLGAAGTGAALGGAFGAGAAGAEGAAAGGAAGVSELPASYWSMLAGEIPEGGITLAPGAVASFTPEQLSAALTAGGGATAAGGAGGAGWTLADLNTALNPYAGAMTTAPEFIGAQNAIVPASLGGGAAGFSTLADFAKAAATGGSSAASIFDKLLSSPGLVPTALSSAASLGAGALSANAAGKAADAETQATNAAIAEQRRQFDLTRADNAPFLATGTAADLRKRQLLGLDPTYTGADSGSLVKPFTAETMNADPVYQSGLQFGLDEGTKAINARAIAGGGYDSGATLKALTRYGNDYASTKGNDSFNRYQTEGSNIYSRLSGASGAGQTAVSTNAAAGTAATNAISNSLTDAGNARAAGIVGGAQAWGGAAQGINNAVNSYSSNQILQQLLAQKQQPTSIYGV